MSLCVTICDRFELVRRRKCTQIGGKAATTVLTSTPFCLSDRRKERVYDELEGESIEVIEKNCISFWLMVRIYSYEHTIKNAKHHWRMMNLVTHGLHPSVHYRWQNACWAELLIIYHSILWCKRWVIASFPTLFVTSEGVSRSREFITLSLLEKALVGPYARLWTNLVNLFWFLFGGVALGWVLETEGRCRQFFFHLIVI